MRDFDDYLQSKHIKAKRRARYHYLVAAYEQTGDLKEAEYNDLIHYYYQCDQEGKSPAWKSESLSAIRNYIGYLKATAQRTTDPTALLTIKGRNKQLPSGILTEKELEELYESYTTGNEIRERNKLILGLVIWQGLTITEAEELKKADVDLNNGIITVPKSPRINARTLELKATQLIPFYTHVAKTTSKYLFESLGEASHMRFATVSLKNYLKKHYPLFNNFKQLRQSRIALWTLQYDIRKVQYLAGHKYISSTERYAKVYQEDLKEKVHKYHPLD